MDNDKVFSIYLFKLLGLFRYSEILFGKIHLPSFITFWKFCNKNQQTYGSTNQE